VSTAASDRELSPPAVPVSPLHRLAAALTYRDFRVLWCGAFTSSIGTWMQKVAQNWLVVTITGSSSAFFLGLDSFLGELPILLFTLIGGVVADRQDRRRLLLMSQYIQRPPRSRWRGWSTRVPSASGTCCCSRRSRGAPRRLADPPINR
jgi:MFS family permease